MYTRVSIVFGPMLMLIGLCVLFGIPPGWFGPTLKVFLNVVPEWCWGLTNFVAGFLLTHPSLRLRMVRIYVAAVVTMCWVGVSIWPAFPWVQNDHGAHPSVVSAIAWLGITTVIYFDRFHVFLTHEYDEFRGPDDC